MAVTFQRNAGMLVLAIWLILNGLAGMVPLGCRRRSWPCSRWSPAF